MHPINQENKDKKKENKIRLFIRSKNGYYIFCCFAVLVFISVQIFAAQYTYINKATTYSKKTIEIVAPYLNDKEQLFLKAEFASINNKESFIKFQKHLDDIASKNKVEIPKIKEFLNWKWVE